MRLFEMRLNNRIFSCGYFFLILSLHLLTPFCNAGAQSVSINIHADWKFRKAGDTEWLRASVPGTVHTDLLSNKIIPDPFFGVNEKNLQWIDTCDWEYETRFDVDDSLFQRSHCEMSFEGLDTYATVFLNGQQILSADNMFRTWAVDCKKNLKKEKNHLVVRFESAVKRGIAEAKKLPYTLPGDEKIFTRKAQYQYGWDWGPRFVTCGIWRPVKLIFRNAFILNDVHVIIDQLSDSVAQLIAEVNITVEKPATFSFKIIAENGSLDSFNFERIVRPENKTTKLTFAIKNPKRWWCNGLGDASLYHISVQASTSGSGSDQKNIAVGLRTLQLVQEKDAKGKSFYFRINGIPVFMKGANWIPADNFLPRVSDEKYLQLLSDAKDANMNMLRVWGGGVYERNSFYEYCDSLGILVWQDFMFACAMYPGNKAFVDNVREEIRENVIRLRNHPSLALWCGNNEIDEGWKNWGWQKQYKYAEEDSAKIYIDYLNLFHKIIPDVVSNLDPERSYWESSPSIGWGHKESLEEGDSHYWGVWWGMEPFEMYKKKIGRFMSEYGFQAMPELRTIESFTDEKDRSLSSPEIKNHQKHPTGFETIDHYLNDWYKEPKDFESYIYLTQLLQADGIRTAIEAHRGAKPYCMGTLYWQLSDCWPVASWSSIDYNGRWKALHYAVRESYGKYLISVEDTGEYFNVFVTSDDTGFTKATLRLSAVDFSGNVLWRDSAFCYLSADKATVAYKAKKEDLTYSVNTFRIFLKMDLVKNGQTLATKNYFFKKPKELLLEKPEINYDVRKEKDNISITLSSNTLAKNLFIRLKNTDARFSENYFDLLPKEARTVSFHSALTVEEVRLSLILRSLCDSY